MKYPLLLLNLLLFISIDYSYAQLDWDTLDEANELYRQKDYANAIDKYNDVETSDPYYSSTYIKRSYAYYHLKDCYKALENVEKAYFIKPIDSKYFYMKGQYFDKIDSLNIALFYLDLLQKFDPNNAHYRNYRANVHLELQNFKSAIRDYNFVLARKPNDYNLYFSRGAAKFNLKMKKEACMDWLYAKEHNKSCNNYFFYKCTKEDLRSMKHPKHAVITTRMPSFQCDTDTSFFSYANYQHSYPTDALLNEQQGTVLVKYAISAEGKFQNAQVIHSVNEHLDAEALRIVESSKEFWKSPADRNGRPFACQLITPICFRIQEPEFKEEQLLDSLKTIQLTDDFQKVEQLASQILKLNPFNYEISLLRKNALTRLNQADSSNYDNIYKLLRSNDVFIMKEITGLEKCVKIYFNNEWEISTPDKAAYYRLTKWDVGQIQPNPFADYTIDGKLYAKGSAIDKTKEGTINLYHPNGSLKSEIIFDAGRPLGLWKFYHANGQIKDLVEISSDNFHIIASFDSLGNSHVADGTGHWSCQVPTYNKADTLLVTGEVKNKSKVGTWELKLDSQLAVKEKYKEDQFISGQYTEGNQVSEMQKPAINSWIFIPGELTRSLEKIYDPQLSPRDFLYLSSDSYLNGVSVYQ